MQNFGQIHETIKNVLIEAIVDKKSNGKEVFKKYVKILKNDSNLKTQFKVFERLENKSNNDDTERNKMFVDECISILEKLNVNSVNKSNNKLFSFLKKNNIALLEDYENKFLHSHIHNLAFTKKNSKNIDSIIESKLYLNKYSKLITENKDTIEPYINKFIGPVMIEKFNEKYKDKLSESEKKAFKIITNGSEEDKQELYRNTINECIDLINNKLNEECTIQEKDKFLQVKDKLLRYEYNSEKFISEITKIVYLKDTLK